MQTDVVILWHALPVMVYTHIQNCKQRIYDARLLE